MRSSKLLKGGIEMGEKLVWTIICLLILSLIASTVLMVQVSNQKAVPTADEIAAKINVPAAPSINLTDVENQIADIKATVNEDKNWETQALDLATTEYSDKNNKALFNAIDDLFGNIEDREDITKIVVKDTEVKNSDVDDKDAKVVQELKIYYEPSDSTDTVKVYLTVTTVIKDGEVTDQKIVETD